MRRTLTSVDAATGRDDFAQLTASFHRSLGAERKSPANIRSYDKAGKKLYTFLREQGMLVEVASIRREHVGRS